LMQHMYHSVSCAHSLALAADRVSNGLDGRSLLGFHQRKSSAVHR
jgi:hypothetical protein